MNRTMSVTVTDCIADAPLALLCADIVVLAQLRISANGKGVETWTNKVFTSPSELEPEIASILHSILRQGGTCDRERFDCGDKIFAPPPGRNHFHHSGEDIDKFYITAIGVNDFLESLEKAFGDLVINLP